MMSNIVVPAITGLFFFIYFVYFSIAYHSKAQSFAYFIAFLLSFSLFLLGRPLQLLLGPHPFQLIIVNIRMLVFCGVSITTITIASNIFSNRRSSRSVFWIFAIGSAFAVIYIVFNSLGTIGSYPAFTWGNLIAYEADTPAMRAPYYGREVTIAVQVMIGILLIANSLARIIGAKSGRSWGGWFRDKVFLFNSGIFLFAMTFTIGSFTKQWWLYYFSSMFSAMLFGAGVINDIRELQNNYEKLIPIIKDDIIQNVAFSKYSKRKLKELLVCLDKEENLDTFAILQMKNPEFETGYELTALNDVTRMCAKILGDRIGQRNYIIIPLDDRRIGIALSLLGKAGMTPPDVLDFFESLQSSINKSYGQTTAVGIGQSYRDIEDLRTSYHEALHALEYAAGLDGNALIHVDNIRNEQISGPKYPTKEKTRLLAAIKLGNQSECMLALDEYLDAFREFVASHPDSLKVRLYELVGAFIDTAIASGGDEEKLNLLVRDWLRDIEYIDAFDTAAQWLGEIVGHIMKFVSRIRKTRSSLIIDKAKVIIDARFASQISYRDVAKELFISSSYFLSLFKQETESTFVEYLTRVRIDRSKELLQTTDKSITEISYDVGFGNPNYFSSTFKKLCGISAKEFREDKASSATLP